MNILATCSGFELLTTGIHSARMNIRSESPSDNHKTPTGTAHRSTDSANHPWNTLGVGIAAAILLVMLFWKASAFDTLREQFEIKADVHRFTAATSTFVTLTTDGSASAVEYSRNQLAVTTVLQGNAAAEASVMENIVRKSAFREVLKRCPFGDTGLARGDQFTLMFAQSGGKAHRCWGFVDDAPTEIRAAIQTLLRIRGQLRPQTKADAYLRSDAVDESRLKQLIKRGVVPILPLERLDADARAIIAAAIDSPLQFIPMADDQLKKLATAAAQGGDFFVTDQKGGGHQVTLYRTQ